MIASNVENTLNQFACRLVPHSLAAANALYIHGIKSGVTFIKYSF